MKNLMNITDLTTEEIAELIEQIKSGEFVVPCDTTAR